MTLDCEIRDIPNSSNIQRVAYDALQSLLFVKFQKSGWYRYDGVSPEEHIGLIGSVSVGVYFHLHIRNNPNHPCEKVEIEE